MGAGDGEAVGVSVGASVGNEVTVGGIAWVGTTSTGCSAVEVGSGPCTAVGLIGREHPARLNASRIMNKGVNTDGRLISPPLHMYTCGRRGDPVPAT